MNANGTRKHVRSRYNLFIEIVLISEPLLVMTVLELMTAWIVILWRFVATYVRAKHNRAEMPNSNRPLK